MLRSVKTIVSVVSVVSLLVPMVLFAEPPPAGIDDALVTMEEFEGNYHAGKWQETANSSQMLESKIKQIFDLAQRDDFILEEAMTDLQKHVAAKNKKAVEVTYISVQKQYFNYISQFDHPVHPILKKIEQHIMKGAPAAYAEKDYAGVLQEMQTAAMLITHGKAVFVKKDIQEQETSAFVSKIQALNLAGKADEKEKMGELLAKLQKTYATFMEKYKK